MPTASPIKDAHTVVMNGGWNIRVFSPEWVVEHLSPKGDIELGVAIANPDAPIQLKFEGVALQVGAGRLVLTPSTLDEAGFESVQRIAKQIVELLPHTPISAVGVNFKYQIDEPDDNLLSVFDLPDNEKLADKEFSVRATLIKRAIDWDGVLLNLILTHQHGAETTIEFNHHRTITRTAPASAALEESISELQTKTLEALRGIYGLEVE